MELAKDEVTSCNAAVEGDSQVNISDCDEESVNSDVGEVSRSGTKPDGMDYNWHQDPKYRRYWQHYRVVWSWYQQHLKVLNERRRDEYDDYRRRMVMWTQMMQWYSGLGNNPGGLRNSYSEWMEACQQYSRQHDMWQQYCHGYGQHAAGPLGSSVHIKKLPKEISRHVKTTHRHHLKRKVTSPIFHDDHSSYSDPGVYGNESDDGEESEEFEMEITPEMLAFFAQSAKHRKERDAAREEEKRADGDYVDLAEASAYKKKTTVLPPNERPGVKRTAEMKGLYGRGAAMIHGMETALQLNFDRNCDLKTPRLWPQIPLNIVFH